VRNPGGAATYVVKYATKDMLGADIDERGRSMRPRVRASRAPTYGDAVVIRDLEIVQELAKENKEGMHETWRKTLKASVQAWTKSQEPKTIERQVMEYLATQSMANKEPSYT
jgi:hypothetical protein